MFTSQLVMDVLDELEEKSATHSTHDASEVVILTDFARKHGASLGRHRVFGPICIRMVRTSNKNTSFATLF